MQTNQVSIISKIWRSCILLAAFQSFFDLNEAKSTFSDGSVNNCQLQWVHSSQFSIADLIPAGKEDYRYSNGTIKLDITSFVGRVHVNVTNENGEIKSGILPGKYMIPINSFHYPLNGQEMDIFDDFEVLQAPRGSLSWIPGDSLISSEHLIPGGYNPLSPLEAYYICRMPYMYKTDEFLINGHLNVSGVCTATCYGVQTSTTYEVLQMNAYGKKVLGGDVAC